MQAECILEAMATTTRRRLTGPVSQRLRTLRGDLSRQALHEMTGIGTKTIFNYEDPTYTRTRKKLYIEKWAEACGATLEDVIGKPGREVSRRACYGDNPFLTPNCQTAAHGVRSTRVRIPA